MNHNPSSESRVMVGGEDRTAAWQEQFGAAIDQRRRHPRASLFLPGEIEALSLARQPDEAAFVDQFTRLIRYRRHAWAGEFQVPHRPTATGRIIAKLKTVMWKALRYQHDRLEFRQNFINSQLTDALEYQHHALTRRIEALENEVRHLRAVRGTPSPPPDPS